MRERVLKRSLVPEFVDYDTVDAAYRLSGVSAALLVLALAA